MSDETSHHVPVLIIGGGIVGLTASLCLSHHSIKSILIERHKSTSIHPRARSVNARVMEIFRELGLNDAIREAGASIAESRGILSGTDLKSIIEKRKRRTKKGEPWVKLPQSVEKWMEFSREKGTFVTQDMSEPVLFKAAKERGGEGCVRFGVECLGVVQDGEKVTARLRERGSGREYTVTADFLIAADGASSPIRNQLNVPTTGCGTMGHLLNILFTADLKALVEGREFSLCVIDRPEVTGLFTSINNDERWVFHLSYDPARGEKPEDYPPERCKELLKIALGMPDVEIEIISTLPWEPAVRVATKLQHDRIFLAGDAAHQMPPYGGQGATSGIADVYNLSWKLALVLNKLAGRSLLETYDIERQPVGQAAAEASAAMADDRGLLSVKLSFGKVSAVMGTLLLVAGFGYSYPPSNVVIAENPGLLRGWSWKPWSAASLALGLDGRPGTRVPHVWVEMPHPLAQKGKRISTVDLVGKNFVLLTGGSKPSTHRRGWPKVGRDVQNMLKGVRLQVYCIGGDGDIWDIEHGSFERAAGISGTGAVLVRPDGVVAWRIRRMFGDVKKELEEVMVKILCL